MPGIIEAERSIVVAADVEPQHFEDLIRRIGEVAGLGGYKIGFEVGLGLGLRPAVDTVRTANDEAAVIFDMQKAGNDIPDTGKNFARAMARAGVDAAILFPFTGPVTQERWIRELQQQNISVIVGAEMTHENIRASEEGYIVDDAFIRIFDLAIDLGVTDFVVPGNKPERVAEYRQFFRKTIDNRERIREGMDDVDFRLYAPGFVKQGGVISEAGQAAGKYWHAIVGRGIYEAEDPRAAVQEHVQQIVGNSES